MIHCILFIHESAGSDGMKLEKCLRANIPRLKLRVCRTITELRISLMRPTHAEDLPVFIVIADNRYRLGQLVAHSEFFKGRRLILILPDNEAQTRSAGHRLRPRFVTDLGAPWENVSAVLSKMVGTAGPRSQKSSNGRNDREIHSMGTA